MSNNENDRAIIGFFVGLSILVMFTATECALAYWLLGLKWYITVALLRVLPARAPDLKREPGVKLALDLSRVFGATCVLITAAELLGTNP